MAVTPTNSKYTIELTRKLTAIASSHEEALHQAKRAFRVGTNNVNITDETAAESINEPHMYPTID